MDPVEMSEGLKFMAETAYQLWAFFSMPRMVFGFTFSFFGIFAVNALLAAFGYLVFKLAD